MSPNGDKGVDDTKHCPHKNCHEGDEKERDTGFKETEEDKRAENEDGANGKVEFPTDHQKPHPQGYDAELRAQREQDIEVIRVHKAVLGRECSKAQNEHHKNHNNT